MNRNHHPNPARDIERIVTLIVAVIFTAAIGLAGLDQGGDIPAARSLPRDASEHSGHRLPVRDAPARATPPRSGELDAALQRIDHAGAHHG
jgi:hypothetical protein